MNLQSAPLEVHSGKVVDLFNFRTEDVDLRDIARGLSNESRFGNQTVFYSVGQHSVILSKVVPDHLAAAALLHDAAEAYLGDVPVPLKKHLPLLENLEIVLLDRIFEVCGTSIDLYYEVLPYDAKLTRTEARQLLKNATWAHEGDVFEDITIYDMRRNFQPWSPWVAEQNFLKRAKELGIRV